TAQQGAVHPRRVKHVGLARAVRLDDLGLRRRCLSQRCEQASGVAPNTMRLARTSAVKGNSHRDPSSAHLPGNVDLRRGTYALDDPCAALTVSLRSESMPAERYHDAVWQGVPEGARPGDLALRRAFLLERLAALAPRDDRANGPRVL